MVRHIGGDQRIGAARGLGVQGHLLPEGVRAGVPEVACRTGPFHEFGEAPAGAAARGAGAGPGCGSAASAELRTPSGRTAASGAAPIRARNRSETRVEPLRASNRRAMSSEPARSTSYSSDTVRGLPS